MRFTTSLSVTQSSLKNVTQYFGGHVIGHLFTWFFFIIVFGVDPDMTREGGSLPVALTLQETTGKSIVFLPLGACDDGAHSQNEKMDRKNYIEGVSIIATLNDTVNNVV